MKTEIPELPHFIHLIYSNYLDYPWALFLQKWENLLLSLLVGGGIVLALRLALRKKTLIPYGSQNMVELGFHTFEKLILGILGPEERKHLPFLLTLFIYVLCMNWVGLVPFLKSPTSDLSTTAALALCVFFYVQYLNIKNLGWKGFLFHLAGSPKNLVGWLLTPIMIPMELITQISRPITLALRLCGNMLGEHILIAVFALLGIVWLGVPTIPLIFPLQVPFIFLSLLVGFMQALVFTILSTVYIFLSFPHMEVTAATVDK